MEGLEMVKMFGKELPLKDYDCSKDGVNYLKRTKPILNVYVQVEGRCNAKCDFCKIDGVAEHFQEEKFECMLQNLSKHVIIGKIAITGGEPLRSFEKTKRVAIVAKKYCPYVTLNTNGFSIERLERIYPFVTQIDISRHHYVEEKHREVLKVSVPTLQEISSIDQDQKMTINCVMQKGLIDRYEEVGV